VAWAYEGLNESTFVAPCFTPAASGDGRAGGLTSGSSSAQLVPGFGGLVLVASFGILGIFGVLDSKESFCLVGVEWCEGGDLWDLLGSTLPSGSESEFQALLPPRLSDLVGVDSLPSGLALPLGGVLECRRSWRWTVSQSESSSALDCLVLTFGMFGVSEGLLGVADGCDF